MIRPQITCVMALFLSCAASSAHAVNIYSQAFMGRLSLPVYYSPTQPDSWVHRNATHLIKRSVDYQAVRKQISAELSTACTLGRFNQKSVKKYFVTAKSSTVKRSRGVVILGFAHGRGVNLYDPDGLATQIGYLFQHDRSGRCKVFVLG